MPLVFTDLDGTLLDLVTYDPGPARKALFELQRAGSLVVFCSSKTRAEQEAIRADLGAEGPYIVENGSAVVIPDPDSWNAPEGSSGNAPKQGINRLGRTRREIASVLELARKDLDLAFMTYEDLTLDQVVSITGLDRAAAGRAAQRDFSETILTPLGQSGSESALRAYLSARGFEMTCGGRFLTVTGNGADKGRAVRVLHDLLGGRTTFPVTVGIGDSENDRPLLAACDRRFLVRRPDGSWLRDPELIDVEFLDGVGPEGWSQMASILLRNRTPG
jgi:mannosyl-3-phosphoglycerate phosphatase family protein